MNNSRTSGSSRAGDKWISQSIRKMVLADVCIPSVKFIPFDVLYEQFKRSFVEITLYLFLLLKS